MKYWAYINGEVPGCYAPPDLIALPHFSEATLVCPAEGEILEQNWRKAAEVGEISSAISEKENARRAEPPAPPAPPVDALNSLLAGGDIDKLIDDSGVKLFSHVADLMKELENRREERSLSLSYQRQAADLKEQLRGARESAARAEDQAGIIRNLEAQLKEARAEVESLRAAQTTKDGTLAELRVRLETMKMEVENTSRRQTETANDLAIRNRLVDTLSRQLTEKEVALAKALALIRRFEEELARLAPAKPAAASPSLVPAVSVPVESVPAPVASVEKISATEQKEQEAPSPSPTAPGSVPQAQSALGRFLKKHFPSRPQS